MISADEALARLREGNLRFAANVRDPDAQVSRARRAELATGQEPFAIILGCSDSRVPAEIVFDQGLGDLFVIRVAGNIIAPSLVGSVEFAAERFAGVERLEAEDIADAIAYIVTRPRRMAVNEILVRPTQQEN